MLNGQLLINGHRHSQFQKPWSQKAYGRAKSRFNTAVMWNSIWTQYEHLPSSLRILQPLSFYFAFLNRTKPNSQSKSLVNLVISHQFLIKISHRTSNLMQLQCSWLSETDEHQKWIKARSAEYLEKQEQLCSFCLSSDSILVINSLFARVCLEQFLAKYFFWSKYADFVGTFHSDIYFGKVFEKKISEAWVGLFCHREGKKS